MKNFYSWLHSLGARKDPVFHGWQWHVSAEKQREVMASIREQILPARGVRVTTSSIKDFPALDISCQLVDIEDVEKLNKNYETLEYAIEKIRIRASTDAAPESPITTILRCRQRLELLKVPAAIELATDRLAQGFSVGIFVEFRATVTELARILKCPFIDGTVTGEKRDEIISSFQANESRCIVINSAAGGIAISLQDLDGEHPRFGLIFPGFSAAVLTQVLGRFRRDSGRSKCVYRILLAAGSPVERRIKTILDQKLNNLAALTDQS